jgi:hypothetical protein
MRHFHACVGDSSVTNDGVRKPRSQSLSDIPSASNADQAKVGCHFGCRECFCV